MYAAGGEFTTNIDNVGGTGTAAFVGNAIEEYVKQYNDKRVLREALWLEKYMRQNWVIYWNCI